MTIEKRIEKRVRGGTAALDEFLQTNVSSRRAPDRAEGSCQLDISTFHSTRHVALKSCSFAHLSPSYDWHMSTFRSRVMLMEDEDGKKERETDGGQRVVLLALDQQ